MADPRNHYSYGNDEKDDRAFDHSDGQDFDDSSSSKSVEQSGAGSTSRSEIGLEERLTEIFVDEGDGDLLLQNSNREDMVLQWLQALDMQVMGACRSDERLKPLLKMNASNGVAEDSLLAHLSQVDRFPRIGSLIRDEFLFSLIEKFTASGVLEACPAILCRI